MERKRFYFNKQDLKEGLVLINGDEFHHMVNVMRLKAGQDVVLFCGDGLDYIAKIESINKKDATLSIKETKYNNSEIGFNLTIFQALAKGDKLSLIASKFCDVKINTAKLEKMEKVVISASKQCGRSTLLKTDEKPLDFSGLLNEIKNYDVCYLAYENENKETLYQNLIKQKNAKNVAVIIGPEGGFDMEEVRQIISCGAISVSLGNRILRTETAPIYSASVIIGVLEKLQK